MFDPKLFLKNTTTQAGSTKIPQCPVGEYPARIDTVDFREAVAGQNSKTPGALLCFCDVTWEVDSADARQKLGREKVTVRQSMIVDLTADRQGLDMGEGKNVSLNRIRDAVGQNVAGQPWSPEMLIGKLAQVKVTPQKNDPEYNEVSSVGKLG